MKRKTGTKSAMAELLQKSNETQLKKNNIKAPSDISKRKAAAPRADMQKNALRSGYAERAIPRQAPIKEKRAALPLVQEQGQVIRPQNSKNNIGNVAKRPISAAPRRVKKAKKSKKFSKSFYIYAASAVVILGLIAISAVLIASIPVKATVLDGALGNIPISEEQELESFKVGDSDDTSHDSRFYVSVNVYEGAETLLSTASTSVGELLSEMDIAVEEGYLLRENEADIISSDITVNIDKITYGTVEISEDVPYETTYVDVGTIPKGKTSVAKSGVNGVRTAFYNVTYVNGVETERVLTEEKITKSPVNQVVNRGVGGTFTAGGKTYNYSYYIDCKTTVYTGGGVTASGLPASESVIAVDPSVIKLGTKVYVDDPYCYVGFRTAADTGGSIKGNFIDIYFDESNPSLYGYGIRRARVYILE